ncbi:SCO family protein [Halobacillus mangrovi]|uniref:Cytochrome c oxidase assembly protein n=1 Tax=Halobacillus mangrovi TaxID=402384 RepID=A0A1W6A095_9BACI|nr:SCO family protein [Halobacillus mangrovi]ARI78930.1 cytochrome c oxidase assembly protein [Halobacillus mangrovi]
MKSKLLIVTFGILSLILAACGSTGLSDTLDWEVKDFKATTQDEESFSVSELEGKVWLANFIFTSCETICPPMTRNMAKVQDMLKEEGVEAEIVSFSVDPTVDTPEKLKEFGREHGADFSNWTFVTEYKQEQIQNFAQESFKTVAMKTEGNDQVTHGSSIYLVGKDGKVLKKYKGDVDVPYEQIVEDVKAAK